ncbi:polysaccharide deacetylase family protein [Roseomonas sp. CCTCC AB2023176]|uniref:polysaccharide deacetylase family protein n=1 Tax=Roseomonas sp. CCTCC AB2023176 TaxID=3342640 RepID=UPI0035D9528C
MPLAVTFTCDVEPSPTDPTGQRHGAVTRALLDRLDGWDVRGTFFVLGGVAEEDPGLVRAIAARGHEVASHGLRHLPLGGLDAAAIAREARRAREVLEDLTGTAVTGFRAPYFSLTTDAAAEAVSEAGYAYSSSLLPARGFLHGVPEAPRRPFAWACGLLELPAPVATVWGVAVPPLGGMYLRYLPPFDLRAMLPRLQGPLAWTYCHPYDLDEAEPQGRAPGVGWLSAAFLRANRPITARRLAAIHATRVSVPLVERLEEARRLAGLEGQSKGSAEDATVAVEV